MILNSAYLPSGAKKSWIDAEQSLTRGVLKEFLFYTHNFTNGSTANIRLQIWRPIPNEVVSGSSLTDLRYRLVWQYTARNLNIQSARGILWRVSIIYVAYFHLFCMYLTHISVNGVLLDIMISLHLTLETECLNRMFLVQCYSIKIVMQH